MDLKYLIIRNLFQNKAIVGFISRVYYSIPMKLLHHLHDLTFHNIPIVLKILPVNLSAPGDLAFSSNCLSNNPASTLLNGFQLRPSIPTPVLENKATACQKKLQLSIQK